MSDSLQATECAKRAELRQNVYEILNRADMREGSQPSLLRLAKNDEWKAFISLLYTHIRTCPLCRTKVLTQEPREAHTIPERRYS